jgi:hypothetical protein
MSLEGITPGVDGWKVVAEGSVTSFDLVRESPKDPFRLIDISEMDYPWEYFDTVIRNADLSTIPRLFGVCEDA